ncbi:MAG: penicillin-binding protein 1C [Defluviicoccus sp.]|nr:penicillin-binding protein 1C [Defluviicoccus sp.]
MRGTGRRRRIGLVAIALGAIGAAVPMLDAAFPLPRIGKSGLSRALLAEDGSILRVATTAEGKIRLRTDVRDVDPRFIRLLTAYEDRRFHLHPGIDPAALARALWQWASNGRIVSGASTLTMQVARLLEPRPRTVRAKALEMLRALQIDARLSKDEILGLYLTLAPYGGNLEGLRAASLAWLGKEPGRLTDAEAALLVALPQAPSRLRPDRFPKRARLARNKVLRRAAAHRVITRREAGQAMQDGISGERRSLPFHAPHLADRLFARGSEIELRTTLDASLQVRAEALAAAHAEAAGPRTGVAVLVADHRNRMAVRVWVGSPDYLSTRRLGAVDMVRAIRSPGSTLKPFIYGLAFDRAIAHPDTRMNDTPRSFGDYAPGNFDRRYRGSVTLADALRLSLNSTAVAVMDRLGPSRFARALEAAGVPLSLPPGERPGLAVALGGGGLTLHRLVSLYGALGTDGRVRPLRALRSAREIAPRPLLTAPTARVVAAILRDAPPPRGKPPAHSIAGAPRIAAKTGTSFGFRDAWALGVDGRYAAGVWLGRVDGTPQPGRTGRNDALPLLHAVFGLLPRDPARTLPNSDSALKDVAPLALRDFNDSGRYLPWSASSLTVDFPPDGATIALARAGGYRTIPLRASSGSGTIRWMVNGRLLAGTVWHPDGPGQATITALDTAGNHARSAIWVE